jgi:hypothetical protein
MLFLFKNKGVWGLGPHGSPLNKYSYPPPIKIPENASDSKCISVLIFYHFDFEDLQ